MTERANSLVADSLREAADLLEQQNASPFRIRAYRKSTDIVIALDEDIEQRAEAGGLEALVALPGGRVRGVDALIDRKARHKVADYSADGAL